MTQHIVIVGGGFAGLNAALAAARVAEERLAITLVSREPWLTIRPRLYEAYPETLRADLIAPLTTVGVRFIQGDVQAISDTNVELVSGKQLPADRIIIASGSVMALPPISGASDAFSIDDQATALAFDARLALIARTVAVPNLVVIGGGFTGIELALELRDRLAVHGAPAAAEAARIVLADRSPVIGTDLGDGPRPAIRDALAAARVDCRTGVEIASLGPDVVRLADGEQWAADAVILCTGLRAAPLVDAITAAKDRQGRVIVDSYLRIPGHPSMFATGDAAHALTAPGRPTLMSCQHALILGKFAGENAARDLLGLTPVAYAQTRYVTCLALGRSGAVFCEGWDRTPTKIGTDAGAIKAGINRQRIYPPTGSREEILAASKIG